MFGREQLSPYSVMELALQCPKGLPPSLLLPALGCLLPPRLPLGGTAWVWGGNQVNHLRHIPGRGLLLSPLCTSSSRALSCSVGGGALLPRSLSRVCACPPTNCATTLDASLNGQVRVLLSLAFPHPAAHPQLHLTLFSGSVPASPAVAQRATPTRNKAGVQRAFSQVRSYFLI